MDYSLRMKTPTKNLAETSAAIKVRHVYRQKRLDGVPTKEDVQYGVLSGC